MKGATSSFPALLEPRRRSERALFAVVQQAYVEGVSPRRVDDLVQALGCEGISRSPISRISVSATAWWSTSSAGPLDAGPYRYLWLDALTQRVREGGRIVQVGVVVATGVNHEGKREVLGIDVGTSEDGAFRLALLRGLVARVLSGVELVTSGCAPGFDGGDRHRLHRSLVAASPDALHFQSACTCAEERAELGDDDGSHDLPAPVGGGGLGVARSSGGTGSASASRRRRCGRNRMGRVGGSVATSRSHRPRSRGS